MVDSDCKQVRCNAVLAKSGVARLMAERAGVTSGERQEAGEMVECLAVVNQVAAAVGSGQVRAAGCRQTGTRWQVSGLRSQGLGAGRGGRSGDGASAAHASQVLGKVRYHNNNARDQRCLRHARGAVLGHNSYLTSGRPGVPQGIGQCRRLGGRLHAAASRLVVLRVYRNRDNAVRSRDRTAKYVHTSIGGFGAVGTFVCWL